LWLCTLARKAEFGSLPYHPSLAKVSAFVLAIMALQLDAAQHILIKALLKERFETKLIASEALCSMRAV
jgi:hypothetical protein